MAHARLPLRAGIAAGVLCLVSFFSTSSRLAAQPDEPSVVDPQLMVTPVVTGLTTPTTLAFLGPDDLLVLEKFTGQVKRVVGGVVQGVVLDLAVNHASERGLLGIALHPDFPTDPGVYLYWTESSTGSDTGLLSGVPLLANRVDRFVWTGTALTFDRNIISLRARQTDNVPVPGHPGTNNPVERGNHNGGVIAFGPDRKLYVFVGDVGRRGWLQNLPTGPFQTAPFVDDTFGGPQPDAAHLAGVVLRLNDDGSAPSDNPFFGAGAGLGGEVGANVQKVFSYGHRNGFGMAFDPFGGALWLPENGDDAFSELNRVASGMNGGWVQVAGPLSRVAEFREIETTFGTSGLQQVRWPASNLAATPAEVLSRLFMLPGALYSDPALSWKWEIAPGAIGFLDSPALGASFVGDLFMGAATPLLEGGYLFRFDLTADRRAVAVADARLADGVADNASKHDLSESESLLFGTGFGVVTDVEVGPNGNLFLVSLSHGAIYEIARRPDERACPTDLVISDFRTAPSAQEFVDLTNVGSETIDFSTVDCVLGGFQTPSYVGLAAAGTLAPGETVRFGASGAAGVDVPFPNGTLRDSNAGLALLSRETLPNGTSIPDVLPDLVTSLVYMSGSNGMPPVYGFFHVDPAHAALYCGYYAGELHPFGQSQCGGGAPRHAAEGDSEGRAPTSFDAMMEAAFETEAELPTAFTLSAAFPNPFRDVTTVEVAVPETSEVRLVVYDGLGRAVAVLVDGVVEAGRHRVAFEAGRLPSGTYLCRLEAGAAVETLRVVLVR